MRDRLKNSDQVSEYILRIVILTTTLPINADVTSRTFLAGVEEFQSGGPVKGALFIALAAVPTFIVGFSVSFAARGDRYTQDFLSMFQRPNRYR